MVEKELKSFQCLLCAKVLCRKDHLLRHVRSHRGIHFNCTECDAKYTRKERLAKHMNSKHKYTGKKCMKLLNAQVTAAVETTKNNREKNIVLRKQKQQQPKNLTYEKKKVEIKEQERYKRRKNPNISQKINLTKVSCKICLKKFSGISNRDHMCRGGSRYYRCDKCDSKFKVKANFVKHKLTKHPPSVVGRREIRITARKEEYSDSMEMNANYEQFGEFIVDALYVYKGNLNCRVRNAECFVTENAFEMKAHRVKFHILLEKRFSFEKWRNLIPNKFLNPQGSEASKKKESEDATIDVAKIIQNAQSKHKDPMKKDERRVEGPLPIRKDFDEYLVKLKHSHHADR